MDRADVIEFIARLNALVPYVPPMLMDRIKDSPVAKALFAVGAGQAACSLLAAAKPATNAGPAEAGLKE
jgi:hypothetical protein